MADGIAILRRSLGVIRSQSELGGASVECYATTGAFGMAF